MSLIRWNMYALDATIFLVACFLVYKFVQRQSAPLSTPLRGPTGNSRIFGAGKDVREAFDDALIFEGWAKEYGSVYGMPNVFGTTKVLLHDPKAAAHFFMKEGHGIYRKTTMARNFIETIVSHSLYLNRCLTHS